MNPDRERGSIPRAMSHRALGFLPPDARTILHSQTCQFGAVFVARETRTFTSNSDSSIAKLRMSDWAG